MSLTDTFDNPQSRVEAILQNAMGAEHEVVPQSRVEELLERLDGYLENIEGKITDQDEEIIAAVNAWLEDNPDATTTVQDGSVTEAKFTDTLKLKSIKDYVTPQMFGAVGDGVTDDATAIKNAVAYSETNSVPLVFLDGKTYLSSEPIVMENPSILLMYGALKYLGSGTALTIGKSGSYVNNADLTIRVAGERTGSTYVIGSTGVQLINVNASNIKLAHVERFETGVELVGLNGGFSYNSIFIDQLVSCLTLLKLNSKTGGWVNENKFFGGRFQVYSSDSFKSETTGILITSEIDYYNNANVFYSPSLETLALCVGIEYGRLNRFYDCRTENAVKALTVLNMSIFNMMTATYGQTHSDTNFRPEDEINIYQDGQSLVVNNFGNTIFDSGEIADSCVGNNDHVSFAKIMSMYAGETLTRVPSLYAEVGDEHELIMKPNRTVGALISTVNNKTFVFHPVVDGTYRIAVFMFDSDGNILTDTELDKRPVIYITRGLYKEYMYLNTAGAMQNGFTSGSNINQPLIISVPNNCAKAYIGLFGAGSNYTLHRFVIKAKNMDRHYTLINNDTAVLDSIPTSTGKIGQFVKSSSPTSGAIGWFYTGSGWIAVG